MRESNQYRSDLGVDENGTATFRHWKRGDDQEFRPLPDAELQHEIDSVHDDHDLLCQRAYAEGPTERIGNIAITYLDDASGNERAVVFANDEPGKEGALAFHPVVWQEFMEGGRFGVFDRVIEGDDEDGLSGLPD